MVPPPGTAGPVVPPPGMQPGAGDLEGAREVSVEPVSNYGEDFDLSSCKGASNTIMLKKRVVANGSPCCTDVRVRCTL